MRAHRLAIAVSCSSLASALGSTEVRAQTLDWQRNALENVAPTATVTKPTNIPVPFAIPDPRGTSMYRTLDELEKIFQKPGAASICFKDAIGTSTTSTLPARSGDAHTIWASRVTSIDALKRPTTSRPDQSPKGRAILVSGLHAREWAAVEAVTQRLERFQDPKVFAPNLAATVNKTAPGNRDVFFAENL